MCACSAGAVGSVSNKPLSPNNITPCCLVLLSPLLALLGRRTRQIRSRPVSTRLSPQLATPPVASCFAETPAFRSLPSPHLQPKECNCGLQLINDHQKRPATPMQRHRNRIGQRALFAEASVPELSGDTHSRSWPACPRAAAAPACPHHCCLCRASTSPPWPRPEQATNLRSSRAPTSLSYTAYACPEPHP